jgi:hypothetical protein
MPGQVAPAPRQPLAAATLRAVACAAALAVLGTPVSQAADAAGDLADASGYLGALQAHVEPNPALATAYLAFWSAVADSRTPDLSDIGEDRWPAIIEATARVAGAVRDRYGANSTRYRLLDTVQIAADALAADDAGGRTEALLRLIDRQIAPRVQTGTRYSHGGTLADPAPLGSATALWQRCRASAACVAAHDALFGEAMGGVSIGATLAERLAADPALAGRKDVALLRVALATAGQQLGKAAGDRRPTLQAVADGAWRLIDSRGDAGGSDGLRALLTIGSAAATLGDSPPRSSAFAVLRQPLREAAAAAPGSGGVPAWVSVTARLGLLLAGGQALSLFDSLATVAGPARPAGTPPELARLVAGLFAETSRDLAALRTEVVVSANATDTRLAALALAADVLKEDVARIESTQQAQVRGAFAAAEARRWTAFDEDNERCFALRNLDPRTGRLRAAEFRRCEDRFLQGAVRRSQYATRSTDYVLQGRYLEPADLQFPFHPHYPLLLIRGGMEQQAALALPDPVEWLQHTTALVRLYAENPAAPGDHPRRAEVLRQVRAAGTRITAAIEGLIATPAGGGSRAFRATLHDQMLGDYFARLDHLVARTVEVDSGDADPFGKRLTVGLDQPLPGGRKGAALGARLATGALAPCSDAPAGAFTPTDGAVVAESRRFFDNPITAAEVEAKWNRTAVAGFGLAGINPGTLVAPGWSWVAADGLGTLDACLLAFRPEAVDFSRDAGPSRDTFLGLVEVGASIAVRFTPGDALAGVPGFTPGHPIVLATHAATRRCRFGYRRDEQGCSRGRCLADLAPAIWSGDDAAAGDLACTEEPLATQFGARPPAGEPVPANLAAAYWARRATATAALEADLRRSAAFDQAGTAWREYFALAAVTLGTFADGGAAVAPLLDRAGPLSPDGVLRTLLREREDPAGLRRFLQAERRRLSAAASRRGAEIVAAPLPGWGVLPLRALGEGLGRVDLLLAAYTD